jgi:hypothetical protein
MDIVGSSRTRFNVGITLWVAKVKLPCEAGKYSNTLTVTYMIALLHTSKFLSDIKFLFYASIRLCCHKIIYFLTRILLLIKK